jgi:hypothetical protein
VYKADLEHDLQEPEDLRSKPDYQILLNELRISCTIAMLLCLNRAHRMAYILGEILELEHDEASDALSISKDNFRQQLSRARTKVEAFTSTSCGLASAQANCSCEKKLTGSINRNRVDAKNPHFAEQSDLQYIEVKNILADTQTELKSLTLQTSVTHYKSPVVLSEVIESLVDQGYGQASRLNS